MNIGIATIYKCYNFGSFFQAFGFQECLKNLGHTAFFLDTECTYNRQRRRQRLFSRHFPMAKNLFSLRSAMAYRRDWQRLDVAKPNQPMDCVIAGSDEIWNIRNRSFVQDRRFYGMTGTTPCFAYAPCIGGATFQDFSESQDLLNGILSMKRWSARDQATEDFLKRLDAARGISRVLDPSFLVDWSGYERPAPSLGKFIMVYTYDGDWGFSHDTIQQVQAFAKRVNLPLVSFGFLNEWCDKSIACSPLEFLGYLRQATYVVTDTFHGTVMSLHYRKPLACMAPDKEKIASMARWLGLNMGEWTLDALPQEKPYDKLNTVIEPLRHASLAFIRSSIETSSLPCNSK